MAKLTTRTGTQEHKVVTTEEWVAARTKLLAEEKKVMRQQDRLNQKRRQLPWTKVETNYVFDGPDGRKTLSDLFEGNHQLIVYHFMFGPDDNEGCAHCSFWADHFDSARIHLQQRDTNLVVISRAASKKLARFKRRMGWKFKWLSSGKNDFNYDFRASFRPEDIRAGNVFYNFEKSDMDMEDREGASTFYKDGRGGIYHTYSTFARGIEVFNTTYSFLDLTAKGRDEDPDWPQDWVKHHDKYRARKGSRPKAR